MVHILIPPTADVSSIFTIANESFLPLIYNGAMKDMTFGRTTSRGSYNLHTSGKEALLNLMLLNLLNPNLEQRQEILVNVKSQMVLDTSFSPSYKSGIAIYKAQAYDKFMQDSSIVATTDLRNEVIAFPAANQLVINKGDYSIGIGGYSNLVASTEIGSNENLQGFYANTGTVYLYNDNLKYWSDMLCYSGSNSASRYYDRSSIRNC